MARRAAKRRRQPCCRYLRIVRRFLPKRPATRTDWARLDSMTDAEIRAGIEADRDARPTTPEFLERGRVVWPAKSKAKRVGTLAEFLAASPLAGSGLVVRRRTDRPRKPRL